MGVVVASVMGPTWIFVEVASMVVGGGLEVDFRSEGDY